MGTQETIRLGPRQTLEVVSHRPEELELRCTWLPGGGPPPWHWHPTQDEAFEVTAGRLTVQTGAGTSAVHEAGERFSVPCGTSHRMWNAEEVPTSVVWRITPALRTLEMFRALAAGPGAPARVRTVWRFRRELRLGSRRRG